MTGDFLPLPDGPTPEGALQVGRYAGAMGDARWDHPARWLKAQKRAHGHERWFQAGVFAGDLVVVVRLIDHGLSGSSLVWVAELDTGRTLLEHRTPGIPLANMAVGPVAGSDTDASMTLPLARIRLWREASARAWELTAHVPGSALSIGLDTSEAPTPVMFVGEPGPGVGVLTQRFVGLAVRGTVRLRSEVTPLEGARHAAGFLEYGHGFFPRPLAWSSALVIGHGESPWAYASDLSAFGDGGESAVWDGREPRPLGSVALSGSADTREPWRVRATDLGLSFQPRAICNESIGFGPKARRHALVAGRFEGRVGTPGGARIIDAPGLCEARAFG